MQQDKPEPMAPKSQPNSLQAQPNHTQHNHQQASLPEPQQQQFRTISRNNSNASTSSSNRGELSSTLSTTNSVTSSRSQLVSRAHQLMATCGAAGKSSTPIRSFQRATFCSAIKTRAFDNNPMLKGLLASSPSAQNSATNSQASSPLSTPVFSRSRSLRMSDGPRRYQQSPSHYRTTSRTPEIYSFTPGDASITYASHLNETQAKLLELSAEKSELKESLEFLECERQVLIDSAKELREILQRERSQSKREQEELRKQLTDCIAARVKAESQLTKLDVDTNDIRTQVKKLNEEIQSKDKQLDLLRRNLVSIQSDLNESRSLSEELKRMLSEKLKYNGFNSPERATNDSEASNECASIVTEMARLRLELNEKEKIIKLLQDSSREQDRGGDMLIERQKHDDFSCEIETLNKFLDDTVECIKSWPEELASSSHVQNLMKTLLSAYKPEQDQLNSRLMTMHL